jgi:ubiquinone/menaquinone biosynthesis C-methylase UbiE
MIDSIVTQMTASPGTELLEIGCASGFLAYGLAPKVKRYVGVDVAAPAVAAAQALRIPNAQFRQADGERLPFADCSFDCVVCYDVVTNFPDFQIVGGIVHDALRVVRPGGRVLIGSIPDAAMKEPFEERAREVSRLLEQRFGPPPQPAMQGPSKSGLLERIRVRITGEKPQIVCYYFGKEDFLSLARSVGAAVQVHEIHARSPYFGMRFNAVYTKAAG